MGDEIFKFGDYPELLKPYKHLELLNKKLTKLSMKHNGDTTKVYKQINDYTNEFSQKIFDVFNGKVKIVYHETMGPVNWDEVFGTNFNVLDINQRKCLVGLLEGNFVYRLPPEFYYPDPYLEGYYTNEK